LRIWAAKDNELAAKDAELEQASAAAASKVCLVYVRSGLVRLTHRFAQDEVLAAKNAELEQASTANTAKVCFFRTISLSQSN
jgi:hypothetical protein